ncbi:septum site-determining protein MinD [Arthrobacter sp. Hiyo8]|nr:septum site-determining protein MinD [Arthrobacter sp. Hiyo8]
MPTGLQEVSFQLEPQRVVGGRLVPGDHVGIFISMSSGGSDSKSDKGTTQLTIPKVLLTAVQRAPQATASQQPTPTPGSGGAANSGDTSLPTGSLLLTVAVSDVDAAKIVFAAEYAKIWLSKEPLDAKDSGPPSSSRAGYTGEPFCPDNPNTDFDQRLRQAVAGGLPGSVQTFFTSILPADPAELFGALNQEQLEVLILGPDVPVEDALRLATVFDVQLPELSVILVSELDPAFVLQAMRSGIRDIMSPDADLAQIRVMLERACQSFASRQRTGDAKQSGSPKGLVIGVFSPKGGVGKTTIATNIAVGLGKIAPMSVVIVDLDLQFGDVASGLYLNPEHTVTDAVTPSASQDSLVLKAFLTVHPASIYALCAPKDPVEADEISPEQVGRLLEQLAQEFQYVVVDTAPGLPEIGLAALEQCSDAVWVTGMDVPSVRAFAPAWIFSAG